MGNPLRTTRQFIINYKNKEKMKQNLKNDFAVDKATNTITIVREFAAELPLVWDAFTKSELLDQWWAPKPWQIKTKSQSFTEGGQWLYVITGPEGMEQWSVTNYIKIYHHDYFTAKDGFSDANGTISKDMPQSDWHMSFRSNGDTTTVSTKLVYGSPEQLEATINMGFKEGYSAASDTLDTLLEQWKK
jgi:uncharacterized protein YndB with AHSA1/START domain